MSGSTVSQIQDMVIDPSALNDYSVPPFYCNESAFEFNPTFLPDGSLPPCEYPGFDETWNTGCPELPVTTVDGQYPCTQGLELTAPVDQAALWNEYCIDLDSNPEPVLLQSTIESTVDQAAIWNDNCIDLDSNSEPVPPQSTIESTNVGSNQCKNALIDTSSSSLINDRELLLDHFQLDSAYWPPGETFELNDQLPSLQQESQNKAPSVPAMCLGDLDLKHGTQPALGLPSPRITVDMMRTLSQSGTPTALCLVTMGSALQAAMAKTNFPLWFQQIPPPSQIQIVWARIRGVPADDELEAAFRISGLDFSLNQPAADAVPAENWVEGQGEQTHNDSAPTTLDKSASSNERVEPDGALILPEVAWDQSKVVPIANVQLPAANVPEVVVKPEISGMRNKALIKELKDHGLPSWVMEGKRIQANMMEHNPELRERREQMKERFVEGHQPMSKADLQELVRLCRVEEPHLSTTVKLEKALKSMTFMTEVQWSLLRAEWEQGICRKRKKTQEELDAARGAKKAKS